MEGLPLSPVCAGNARGRLHFLLLLEEAELRDLVIS